MRYKRVVIGMSMAILAGLGSSAALGDPLAFNLQLGGPGYAVGFSNIPQYSFWAPPPAYVTYYDQPLYAQYMMWYYYPQEYYQYYVAPPPPPPPGAPLPPPPPPG
ncbi:hypothetical protein HF563_08425, partial [Acidithiobacillus ferridurans]|nr:hypothetical protein [Acidithiobacillus ferridurans]